MKKGDTVRIRKTDMVGTVTEVHANSGRHYSVKFDDLPEIVLYENEIKLIASTPVTPIPCIICGHAHQVTNEDETEFAVYCACGIAQTGETKEEAAANWNALHAITPGRCTFDE